MKTFLKIVGTFVSVFAAIIGAFAVLDRFGKKSYLECDSPDMED